MNVPFRVLVDDPAVDFDPCELDGTCAVALEEDVTGWRPPFQADDGTAEDFRRSPNAVSLAGDALSVFFSIEELPVVSFNVVGFEVFGMSVGAAIGLDSIELRTATVPGVPNMNAAGFIAAYDPAAPIVLPAVAGDTTAPIAPFLVTPSAYGLAGLSVVVRYLAGENAANHTAIGLDTTPETLLLLHSGRIPAGGAFSYEFAGNHMIRMLIQECP